MSRLTCADQVWSCRVGLDYCLLSERDRHDVTEMVIAFRDRVKGSTLHAFNLYVLPLKRGYKVNTCFKNTTLLLCVAPSAILISLYKVIKRVITKQFYDESSAADLFSLKLI